MICYTVMLKGLNGYQREGLMPLGFWENSSGHLYILPHLQQKDERKLEKVPNEADSMVRGMGGCFKRQGKMWGLLSPAK